LLQNARNGAVSVEQALEHIADAQEQIRQVRALLCRLEDHNEDLPLKERCAEALSSTDDPSPEAIHDRADLETAMTTLENTIWNTFLGSGQRRG
jgi:hypothetical protein